MKNGEGYRLLGCCDALGGLVLGLDDSDTARYGAVLGYLGGLKEGTVHWEEAVKRRRSKLNT